MQQVHWKRGDVEQTNGWFPDGHREELSRIMDRGSHPSFVTAMTLSFASSLGGYKRDMQIRAM
jgi:hypothetical protein